MLYPLSFNIQTHRCPSAVRSAEMSLVACHDYWQRPCKTHWIQWSKAPVNLRFTSLTPVDRLWCKQSAAEHLFDQYNMLSVCCCDATRPPRPISSLHFGFPSTCIIVSDGCDWECELFVLLHCNYWHEINRCMTYKRYYLAWQHPEEKPTGGPRCCWFHQTTPESFWEKNSLLQSFSDCEQTDRERSDIDLLRLRIMFKGVRLQGVGWSGFIKCKHFQERNSLKWEKSREWEMRER